MNNLNWRRNVLQRRFDLPEAEASLKASYLLAGSVILYPVVCSFPCVTRDRSLKHGFAQTGLIVDRVKKRNIVMRLLLVSGALTLGCYLWLAAPPKWTQTPMPAIVSFALGHGFSPRTHEFPSVECSQEFTRRSRSAFGGDCATHRSSQVRLHDAWCAQGGTLHVIFTVPLNSSLPPCYSWSRRARRYSKPSLVSR